MQLKLYYYQAERNFKPPEIQLQPTDLCTADDIYYRKVDDPHAADFIVFPYSLDQLFMRFGLAGTQHYIRQLPYFEALEHKHVFVFYDDHNMPLHIRSVVFRYNVYMNHRDPNAIPMPYFIDDISGFLDFSIIRYHLSFVGDIASHWVRPLMLLPFFDRNQIPVLTDILRKIDIHKKESLDGRIGSKEFETLTEEIGKVFPLQRNRYDLNVFFDINPDYHKRIPGEEYRIKRREFFLNTINQSIGILCPRGYGLSSTRIFETMAAGRIPLIISDDYVLPMENEIDYSSFIIRIPENEVVNIPFTFVKWLSENDFEEIKRKCLQARAMWRRFFHPSLREAFFANSLMKVKMSNYA